MTDRIAYYATTIAAVNNAFEAYKRQVGEYAAKRFVWLVIDTEAWYYCPDDQGEDRTIVRAFMSEEAAKQYISEHINDKQSDGSPVYYDYEKDPEHWEYRELTVEQVELEVEE